MKISIRSNLNLCQEVPSEVVGVLLCDAIPSLFSLYGEANRTKWLEATLSWLRAK